MSFLILEDKHWPIALTVAQGKLTLTQHNDCLTAWDKWFALGKPFHVMRFYEDSASLEQDKGVGKATQTWMNEGADNKFRTLVKNMLIIVPPDQFPRVEKMSVRKVFGISGGIFPSVDAALDWLENSPESSDNSDLPEGWLPAIRQTHHDILAANTDVVPSQVLEE